jgi:LysM repeat protein
MAARRYLISMSSFLVLLLLVCALVLPIIGAAAIRAFAPRLTEQQAYVIGGLILALAVASVIVLSRANITSLQLGSVSLLLSDAPIADVLPADIESTTVSPPPDEDDTAQPVPAATEESTPTADASTTVPTAVPTNEPTTVPTTVPTDVPTATPTPEPPTPEPTAVPTEPPPPTEPPAPAPRTYAVQQGDTLRSIAEQFDVSVQAILDANNLTPAQADALRIGQELVIP